MSDEPTILHADLDAFFASVEQRDDPRLRGRPVIVGPGVVLAASYEARRFGVRSAMGAGRARRLCPHAVVVDARFSAYLEASRAVMAIFDETTPVVERLSIDEAFLDVRGLRRLSGPPLEIAARLRRDVREHVGLAITVGVARTKFLAKVAGGVAKPDGLVLVPPGAERGFLRPLPVERLWGVGPATARRLHARGVTTVGDLAALEEAALVATVGRAAGRHLHALARGRDLRRVRARRRRSSIGSQSALGRRARTVDDLDAVLIALVDRVTRRMRAAGRAGRTIVLRLRFDDFTRATRSRTLTSPTASTQTVLAAARALLAAAMPTIERHGLTLLGITVANLDGDAASAQLALPLDEVASRAALDAVLDDVRERFGPSAVMRATLLRRGRGLRPSLAADDDAIAYAVASRLRRT